MEGLCIQCLPCSKEMAGSSKLHEGCPPIAPFSTSALGLIRHDIKEY
jgi:hypothetical protein